MSASQWSDGAAGPLLKVRGGDWHDHAACVAEDPGLFFSAPGQPTAPARAVCARCPVRGECLDDALECERGESTGLRHGIFGGLGPRERWKIDRASRGAAA